MGRHLRRGPRADHLAPPAPALGSEVDDPVGGAHHLQVVLDDHHRVAGRHQRPQRPQERRDVLRVQPRRRLVEQEQNRNGDILVFPRAAPALAPRTLPGCPRPLPRCPRPLLGCPHPPLGNGRPAWLSGKPECPHFRELEALGLAAGEGGDGLAEAQVVEADGDQRLQGPGDFGVAGEEGEGLGDGQVQHVGNRPRFQPHLEHLGPVPPAIAVGAAQVDVGQELHLHVLETVPAAGRATPVTGVEAEGARGVAPLPGERLRGKALADGVEGADVARGVGAGGLADGRLVHEDRVPQGLVAPQVPVGTGRLGRAPEPLQQPPVQDLLHQRRLARATDPGDADQPPERDTDVDPLQVVLRGTQDLEPAGRRVGRASATTSPGGDDGVGANFPASACRRRSVARDECLRPPYHVRPLCHARRTEEHHLAASLARPRPQLEDPVRGPHDLGVVLDHHQRVAGVTQAPQDADDPPHVPRVQPDAGLVQDEERVDEGGAERGRQVDPLHLATRERARLAIQREVTDPDLHQVGESGTDLAQQQVGRLVEGGRQVQAVEKGAGHPQREAREVVQGQARQGAQHGVRDDHPGRAETGAPPEGPVSVLPRTEAPEKRLGLEAGPAAGRADRVAAVLREQHPHVHLVGLALEPGEEAPDAVPDPVFPLALALQHPAALLGGEVPPGHVGAHPPAAGEAHQVVLALPVALGLPGAHRPAGERAGRVGDDQFRVDAEGAPEAPAGLAGPEGRVEGEEARHRVPVAQVAVRAVQVAGEAPGRGVHVGPVHGDPPPPPLERRLQGLDQPRAPLGRQPQAVLHHLQHVAIPPVDSGVTLARQEASDLVFGEGLGDG